MPMAIDLSLGFGAFTPSGGGGGNQTWDPAKKSADFTLSNADRTAVNGVAAWRTALAQTGKSTGKWCIAGEITNFVSSNDRYGFGIGVVPGAYTDILGTYSTSLMIRAEGTRNETGFTSGVNQTTVCTASGFWVAVYVDFDAGKVWTQNSVNSFENGQDPATGANPYATFTGGSTYYFATSTFNTGAGSVTILSGTNFPTSVPSGFTAW
jgi:hypothetical protein